MKKKKSKKLGKKGQGILLDFVLIPVMLAVVVFTFFCGYWVYDVFKEETTLFNGEGEDGGSAAQGEVRNSIDVTTGMFPYLFIMIVASMIVLFVLSAYIIDSSIIFFVVGVIFLIITLIISVPFSNFYQEFRSESGFENTNDAFMLPNIIMDNLPYFVFFIGGTFLLILYGKKSDGGFSGGGGGYY